MTFLPIYITCVCFAALCSELVVISTDKYLEDWVVCSFQALETNGLLQDAVGSSSSRKLFTNKRRQPSSSQSAAMSADFAVLENRRDKERYQQHSRKQGKEPKRNEKFSASAAEVKTDDVTHRIVKSGETETGCRTDARTEQTKMELGD